jgi:CBS domain-containing protein
MPDKPEVIAGLRRYAPFDAMAPEDLEFLAARVEARTWSKDATILDPAAGVPGHLYIVASGSVLSKKEAGKAGSAADLRIGAGECFPLGPLMSGSAVSSVYVALEDTELYLLPEPAFRELKERSVAFRDFCTRRLASLLERSKRLLRENGPDPGGERSPVDRLLSTVLRRAPVTCRPDDSIESVLATMHELAIGSVVAVDDAERPVGIFTLHDVLNRVALPRQDLAAPIASVMSTELSTLPAHATAYEAALAMVRRGIRHVIVVEDGRIAGVVSERDLFNLQRVSLRQLSRDIKQAPSAEALVPLAGDVRSLAKTMLAQGVSSEQLTQFIASLNDLLTARLLELEFDAANLRGVEFCWIALGSEGRFEQTLATDQDNGIIFEAGAAARLHLLRLSRSLRGGAAGGGAAPVAQQARPVQPQVPAPDDGQRARQPPAAGTIPRLRRRGQRRAQGHHRPEAERGDAVRRRGANLQPGRRRRRHQHRPAAAGRGAEAAAARRRTGGLDRGVLLHPEPAAA